MMYFAKKLIGALALPLGAATVIAVAALVLWARRRRQGAARLFISAAVLVYVTSLVPFGYALLGPLERQYPSLGSTGGLPAVRYIVVLGSSYAPRSGVSVTGALDEDGLVRIVEGCDLRAVSARRDSLCRGARRRGVCRWHAGTPKWRASSVSRTRP
jgi:hypothetical protein